ncbi:UNVERIFIED_CONTAM: hypothetical protein Scaly_2030500 [Sesamum calycinum]|uniref:Uncharacterized protein n=1 Tax=Sesamum calycinum TaxID=2727403 RepID=A0AAW2N3J6_9LAMI
MKLEQMEANQLIQFLTGLNESYDNIRNQILVLDPLPNVNKAYLMVFRVERQRQVNLGYADSVESSTILGRGQGYRGGLGQRNNMKRKGHLDKRNMICEIYHKSSHGKDTCFKIHGVPEWYKDLNGQKKRNGTIGRAYATSGDNFGDTHNTVGAGAGSADLVTKLMQALRLIQNKMPHDPVGVHFAETEMTGYVWGHKGYKLLDMVNNNVLISRDVFHENIFSYHSSKSTEPDPIPIPNPIPDTIIPALLMQILFLT